MHDVTDPLGSPVSLGELLDGRNLEEILASFYALFRIPIRILDDAGATIGRSKKASPLTEYLGQLPEARKQQDALHQLLRTREPEDGAELSYTAFTGASYRVVMVVHDASCVGRFILGPFITPDVREAPATLLACDARADAARCRELLLALPRVREDTVKAIARHLSVTLDALIFAGHRARLSELMHLSTVQENQRQISARDEGLQAAEERLLESGRSQAHFLVTALSELRAPLESIMGHSETLTVGGVPGEHRELVAGIRQRAAQLLGLSNRLLDFSKADRGAISLRRDPIDVPALLARVASRLAALAPERARDVRVESAADLPSVFGDVASVEQVLMLLGENALRFAAAGTISIRAQRAAGSDDADGMVLLGGPPETIELWVSDSGIGIPDAEKERVFEPFYQVAREADGTPMRGGLGLATAKRLITAHGGSIRVEDNPPRGTRVVVTLPVAPG
jgi:signal transduction histidine kinase